MNSKTVKTYSAPTPESFNALLNVIYGNSYPVDVYTDRKSLKVTVVFDNEEDTAIKDLSDIAEEADLKISDDNAVFMFTEDREPADIEKRIRQDVAEEVRILSKERDEAIRAKEFYLNRNKKSQEDCSRIKSQIRAISDLLATLDFD